VFVVLLVGADVLVAGFVELVLFDVVEPDEFCAVVF
jgi:hypothetical protein